MWKRRDSGVMERAEVQPDPWVEEWAQARERVVTAATRYTEAPGDATHSEMLRAVLALKEIERKVEQEAALRVAELTQ